MSMMLKLVIPLLETHDHHARSMEIETIKLLFRTRFVHPIATWQTRGVGGVPTYSVTLFLDGGTEPEQAAWAFLAAHPGYAVTLVPPRPRSYGMRSEEPETEQVQAIVVTPPPPQQELA